MKATNCFLKTFLGIIIFSACLPAQNGLYENWVRHYAGPFSVESAEDITVDPYGNVYMASQSFDTTTYLDYAVIKYDSDGNLQWVRRYSSPGLNPDRANAIVVDRQGNVYVTGSSASDYLTIKYNSGGVQQWLAFYNGPGDKGDIAKDIVVDDSGYVYVTGTAVIANQPYSNRFATIKYDSSGIEQWVSIQSINAPGDAEMVSVDSSGNIYVSGKFMPDTLDEDYLTIKYDSNGIEQWTASYNRIGNSLETATDMAIDDSANVYVTGYSMAGHSDIDYATVKYNSEGVKNGPLFIAARGQMWIMHLVSHWINPEMFT